jgi:hypothetical protein
VTVALRGSSAATLIAGILLLSRARGFGQRLQVEIVGDPNDITPVKGPAVAHSAVLASCGIGRELGSGALVIIPGPAVDPLATCLVDGGEKGWFFVDRSGSGAHEATRQFVALCRERDPQLRERGRQLRAAMAALGCSAEPAVLDLLFAAPAPPLQRLAAALRAGRAMSGGRGAPVTRYLADFPDDLPDPLSVGDCQAAHIVAALDGGGLQRMLDRLRLSVRDPVEDWVRALADAGEGYHTLLASLVAVLSHLTSLPPQGMLPPLPPAMDAVSVGIGPAIGATGQGDACQSLREVFMFLGGRFTDYAKYAIEIPGDPPPDDRLARWVWLCRSARRTAEGADELWRNVVDPLQ